MRDGIPKTIREEIIRFEQRGYRSVYEINNGGCEDFAVSLEQKIPGSEMLCTHNFSDENGIFIRDNKRIDLPNHCWLRHEGKHYDAENPEGVTDFLDLDIFKRLARTIP